MLTPLGRKLKQSNILLFLLILVIEAVFLIYISRLEPQRIEIKSIEIGNIEGKLKEEVWKPPFTYQLSVEITNPNKDFVAKDVFYSLEIKNEKNEVITKKEGKLDIGTGETKKLEEELIAQNSGKNFEFKIAKIAGWEKVLSKNN